MSFKNTSRDVSRIESDSIEIGLAESGRLDPKRIPRHIAVIMDGNGRWAQKRALNRVKGHEKGLEAVRTVIRTCRKLGVSTLTLYAFSTENWQRPKLEVAALMSFLKKYLKSERQDMVENGIRLNIIGQKTRLPDNVQTILAETMALTANGNRMLLNLALSYGGRTEITDMTRKIAEAVQNKTLAPDEITEAVVADHLYTAGMDDPDLLIRTSGEMRISNFLLWQIAYAEIVVTPTLWPDFGQEELFAALRQYQARDRRFGKVKIQ